MEVWKDIPGYGDHYQASNFGKIRVKDRCVTKFSILCGKVVKQHYRGRELSCRPTVDGYAHVHLGVNKKKYSIQVGRLVLLAFVGTPPDGFECCHCDGNPANNKIENLRWDSHLENNRDRVKHKTYKTGSAHHFSKFSDELVEKVVKGEIDKKSAMSAGISNTHYYRLRKKNVR